MTRSRRGAILRYTIHDLSQDQIRFRLTNAAPHPVFSLLAGQSAAHPSPAGPPRPDGLAPSAATAPLLAAPAGETKLEAVA